MWTYRVIDGELLHDGEFVGTGYSGTAGETRNNPDLESLRDKGPIPRTEYIIGEAFNSIRLGPCVMELTPVNANVFGRFGFYIHGDNARHDASHGCIILGPAIRKQIAGSYDSDLEVI